MTPPQSVLGACVGVAGAAPAPSHRPERSAARRTPARAAAPAGVAPSCGRAGRGLEPGRGQPVAERAEHGDGQGRGARDHLQLRSRGRAGSAAAWARSRSSATFSPAAARRSPESTAPENTIFTSPGSFAPGPEGRPADEARRVARQAQEIEAREARGPGDRALGRHQAPGFGGLAALRNRLEMGDELQGVAVLSQKFSGTRASVASGVGQPGEPGLLGLEVGRGARPPSSPPPRRLAPRARPSPAAPRASSPDSRVRRRRGARGLRRLRSGRSRKATRYSSSTSAASAIRWWTSGLPVDDSACGSRMALSCPVRCRWMMTSTPGSRLESLFARLRARWVVVALYALLLPGALVFALRIPRDNALERMVVAGNPDVRATREFQRVFPEKPLLILVARTPDPFFAEAIDGLAALHKEPRQRAEGGPVLGAHRLGAPASRCRRAAGRGSRFGGVSTLRRGDRFLSRPGSRRQRFLGCRRGPRRGGVRGAGRGPRGHRRRHRHDPGGGAPAARGQAASPASAGSARRGWTPGWRARRRRRRCVSSRCSGSSSCCWSWGSIAHGGPSPRFW